MFNTARTTRQVIHKAVLTTV